MDEFQGKNLWLFGGWGDDAANSVLKKPVLV
jgi:hypothetical protein